MSFPVPARRMTSLDAGFLYLERAQAPLHVGCLLQLDGALSLAGLMRHMESRMPRLRRFSQRPAPTPFALAHPAGEDDRDFDQRHHVQRWRVPEPGGDAELGELVETLMARSLERRRPLWEAHLVEGPDGGGAALLFKVHHCMIDGVSGAALLQVLLETSRHAPHRVPPAPPEDRPSPPARAVETASAALAGSARLAVGALDVLRRTPVRHSVGALREAGSFALAAAIGERQRMPWNAPLGARRSLALTRLSLQDARWIRSAHGGTVNDVVLTALAGGLRRYLQASGVSLRDATLHALVPVSLRSPGEVGTLGNRISALRVPLALAPEQELERLRATCETMEGLKERRAFVGLGLLLGAIELLPAPLVALAGSRARLDAFAHLVASNVPGPREQLSIAGHPVRAIHAIAPITDGMGLSVAIFSYRGWLHLTLYADADLVPDLDKLRAAIEEAFAALRGAA